jgi:hypothetical protein
MIHVIHSFDGLAQDPRIKKIAVDILQRQPLKPPQITGPPYETANCVTPCNEKLCEMAPDEP